MFSLWNIITQITLEPSLFFYAIRNTIDDGAQVTTNLLINKICHVELNYSEEICGNLTNEEFSDIYNIVQQETNNFLMISEWIGNVPPVVYALFAGSLLDQFGCKPFLLMPLIGAFISDVCLFFNFAFLDGLPIEFFYTINIYFFFGGVSVFYLGSYSYGSLNFNDKNRAPALARYDGVEVSGMLAGTALSPIILFSIGAFGNYGIKIGSGLIAICYITIFIPHKPSEKITSNNIFMDLLILPLIDMIKTLLKRRPRGMHWLIAIQMFAFALYWFVVQEFHLRYLYMLKTFDGFDGTSYSWYIIFSNACSIVGLLVLIPIMSNYFLFHDAAMLTICVGLEAFSKQKIFSLFNY